jgi:hypothetical protein
MTVADVRTGIVVIACLLLVGAAASCGREPADHSEDATPEAGASRVEDTGEHAPQAASHGEGQAEEHGSDDPGGGHEGGSHEEGGHGAFPRDYAGPIGGRDPSPTVQAELWTVEALVATGFEGPGGEPILVARRTPEIGHYPCVSCHSRPIGSKDLVLAQMHQSRAEHLGAAGVNCNACHDMANPGGLILDCTQCHEREGGRELMPSVSAHLTIQLGHPTGRYRNCLTCHAPENPGLLALPDGDRATMDEAYRLCSGCHFMQARDWAGGGHGKRMGGWQGERVVLSCTGCHNPHDPRFPVRRPVTFPKIARTEAGK